MYMYMYTLAFIHTYVQKDIYSPHIKYTFIPNLVLVKVLGTPHQRLLIVHTHIRNFTITFHSFKCTYIHTHTHTQTHSYTHIHTHTHTYIHTCMVAISLIE